MALGIPATLITWAAKLPPHLRERVIQGVMTIRSWAWDTVFAQPNVLDPNWNSYLRNSIIYLFIFATGSLQEHNPTWHSGSGSPCNATPTHTVGDHKDGRCMATHRPPTTCRELSCIKTPKQEGNGRVDTRFGFNRLQNVFLWSNQYGSELHPKQHTRNMHTCRLIYLSK